MTLTEWISGLIEVTNMTAHSGIFSTCRSHGKPAVMSAVLCGRRQQWGLWESWRKQPAPLCCLLRLLLRTQLLPSLSAKLSDPAAHGILPRLHPSPPQLPFQGQVQGRILLITGLSSWLPAWCLQPVCLLLSASQAGWPREDSVCHQVVTQVPGLLF